MKGGNKMKEKNAGIFGFIKTDKGEHECKGVRLISPFIKKQTVYIVLYCGLAFWYLLELPL